MIQIKTFAKLAKSLAVKREKDADDDTVVACHLRSWQIAERMKKAGIDAAGERLSPHQEYEATASKALIGGICRG